MWTDIIWNFKLTILNLTWKTFALYFDSGVAFVCETFENPIRFYISKKTESDFLRVFSTKRLHLASCYSAVYRTWFYFQIFFQTSQDTRWRGFVWLRRNFGLSTQRKKPSFNSIHWNLQILIVIYLFLILFFRISTDYLIKTEDLNFQNVLLFFQ